MARGDLKRRLDEAALDIVRRFATGRIRGGGPALQVVNNQ
jgi:hypothetical protein